MNSHGPRRLAAATAVVWAVLVACGTPAVQAPSVTVVFHTPAQDEAGVSLSAPIRLTFSADLEASTIEPHLTLAYSADDSRDRGEPEPPSIRFTTTYDRGDRSVTIRPAQGWERFREVRLRLSDGIHATSGAALSPFSLTFTTGGSHPHSSRLLSVPSARSAVLRAGLQRVGRLMGPPLK